MAAFVRKTAMAATRTRQRAKARFESSVFINCPLDDDYRQLLLSLIFTVRYLGYLPRLSLERADSSDSRVQKIVGRIKDCRFGIHDLSRIVASEADQFYRMNMPFELGIDYGAKVLGRSSRWSSKKILILETERYRFQKALSDLSGSDIKAHGDDPFKLIEAVRDWFVVEEECVAPAPRRIWDEFNFFSADLADRLLESGYDEDEVEKIPIPEVMYRLDEWLA